MQDKPWNIGKEASSNTLNSFTNSSPLPVCVQKKTSDNYEWFVFRVRYSGFIEKHVVQTLLQSPGFIGS